MFTKKTIIGVVGSGAMGSGIAQVSATAEHKTIIYDTNVIALEKSKTNLTATLTKLVEKQKITQGKADSVLNLTSFTSQIKDLNACQLIIEAIIENSEVKQKVFQELESIVAENSWRISFQHIFVIHNFYSIGL